ncbi:oligoendopeptidase F [Brucepastera parasyntrophica]|uniref:oligoendopeptidase F n=1 Tax=Brucepastera parasyntrophica TaxID=2880008 RepID=UPI00210EA74C|nr:oligoendopeptidase F [Brucepastera parasyntrophica]ULQ60510.1 oligoendopeptidase F [Brucepastera parasyntrophica]
MKQTAIPNRSEVAPGDQWNLSSLFAGDNEWNSALEQFSGSAEKINKFRDSILSPDITPEDFAGCLKAYSDALQLADKLGNYAFLKKSADEGDSENLDRLGRFMMAASSFEASVSWLVPAIQNISEDTMKSWMEMPRFADYRIWLEKLLRMKPYILGEKEERILALLSEAHQTPQSAFSVLTNVDFDFGTVKTPEGDRPLSQTTWSMLMENRDRSVRKETYDKFYGTFDTHKNTIAALYAGSVNQDVAAARIRGYSSARAMELFPDRVPETVYDNLVATVRANLAPLHRYYSLRKKVLKLNELRHYDVLVPLVGEVKKHTPYDEAVSLIGEALKPLGNEYVKTITDGLLNGWVDRYENKGKRSGAFSSGGYEGSPYILMNYKEDVLRDVFTLAHEGGHSMHSWYSAKNNPFMSYNYTIFEAEVASTFNEDLVFRYLLKTTDDPKIKAYLLASRAGDILATLYRQTMFAEFESKTHEMVESGIPLTIDVLRREYRDLLKIYFGPEMIFEETSDLEGIRIPHFYNAFYVYKYATGISASLALAERVVTGGEKERNDYFAFLKSGGSRYPIEALRIAGVDMESAAPVEAACGAFSGIVEELEKILL